MTAWLVLNGFGNSSTTMGVHGIHLALRMEEEGALLRIAAAGAIGNVQINIAIGHRQAIVLRDLTAMLFQRAAVTRNAIVLRNQISILANLSGHDLL